MKNYRPDSPDLKFQYPYSLNATPPESYIDASITQLFYTANTYHDLLYTLGFNEEAGNFQYDNNGKGGAGNDYVILNGQQLNQNVTALLRPVLSFTSILTVVCIPYEPQDKAV